MSLNFLDVDGHLGDSGGLSKWGYYQSLPD